MMYTGGGGWTGLGGLLFMVGELIVVVGIVVLVVWAVTSFVRPGGLGGPSGGPRSDAGSAALDILRERYARGEITAEEFEQAKKILGY